MTAILNARRHLPTRGSLLLLLSLPAWTLQAHEAGAGARTAAPETGWNLNLPVMISLALLGGLYVLGLARLWTRAGVGKAISIRQAAAYGAGIAVCVAALLSPIATLSDQLSWVHMIQHMLLLNLAAPLLVLGSPFLVLLWALPGRRRASYGKWIQRAGSWQSPWYPLWQPLLLWLLYALALWVWHLPGLYQAALRDPLTHDLQHLSFIVAACLFWRVLLDPVSRLRLSRGAGVFYLFTTSLHATVLGVFMALSPSVWYPDYEPLTAAFNLTALEDQQIAGLIMWMPACALYALAAAILFGCWLRETGPRDGTPTPANSSA